METLLDENFKPSDVRLKLQSTEGDIFHEQLSDQPIPYKNFLVSGVYNYNTKSLRVQDTHVVLNGVEVNAQAELMHDEHKIEGPVKFWIDRVSHSKVVGLWPKFLEGDAIEAWIVDKMSKGIFDKVSAQFDFVGFKQDIEGEQLWQSDLKNIIADFSVEGMRVDYRAPLDAATGLYGSGRYDVNADLLSLDVKKGKIGALDVKGSQLKFSHLAAVGKGQADLSIGLRGEIGDVLRLSLIHI